MESIDRFMLLFLVNNFSIYIFSGNCLDILFAEYFCLSTFLERN